jgi:hypothetical protein
MNVSEAHRAKQKTGQVRVHAGVKQVRVRERSCGALVMRNGRPAYEWVELTPDAVKAHRLEHLNLLVPDEL